MSKRYAILYSDGSFNVSNDGEDLISARKRLGNCDEEDELVQVEIKVIQTFGKPNLQIAGELSAVCDTCHSTVYFETNKP
jgi:hypothetical protein